MLLIKFKNEKTHDPRWGVIRKHISEGFWSGKFGVLRVEFTSQSQVVPVYTSKVCPIAILHRTVVTYEMYEGDSWVFMTEKELSYSAEQFMKHVE